MNNKDESHARNRLKVCIGCMRKGKRSLSTELINLVKRHVLPDFDSEDKRFPAGICNSCYLMIKKAAKGEVKFPDIQRQVEIESELLLRSEAAERCQCQICTVATCKAQAAINMKRKAGLKSREAKTPKEQTKTVCSKCFAEVYRGCKHSSASCASK